MGIIRNAEKAATNIVYKIDDMTAAPMDVRQWVDTDVSSCFGISGVTLGLWGCRTCLVLLFKVGSYYKNKT